MKKRLWFSITAKDCDWQDKRGRGKGGQKKNKTSNAIQCFHRLSGAMGAAEDGRSQLHNKQLAFRRMFDSKEFQSWIKLKIEAGLGHIEIEEPDAHGKISKRKLSLEEV